MLINERSVMLDTYDEKYSNCNIDFTDYKLGFETCLDFVKNNQDSKLRNEIKNIGVEDYFNDSTKNVARKIEDAYPEIANEITNNRIANIVEMGNLSMVINKDNAEKFIIDFISNELDGQDRIDFIKKIVNLL